jgi:galactonate dehydratase
MADRGFTAVKMNATEELEYVDSQVQVDRAVERAAAVRSAVGPSVGIGIDFHGRVHRPMAKRLARALEPFHPMFIEEPVLPENNEALREIAGCTSIPIATGERMYSRWQFKSLLVEGHVDIIQPDLSHAGGITECKKILSMAEAFDVAAAPHCPLGPIALAACLQVDATCHNAFIQEQSLGIHYNQEADLLDYVANKDVFWMEHGQVAIPPGPGLGLEIDEGRVREGAKTGHNWRNPLWRHADGSVAEW